MSTEGDDIIIDGFSYKITTNANTEIPRSHINDGERSPFGTYFNWYAATAESGTYAMKNTFANNSICPRGWPVLDVI